MRFRIAVLFTGAACCLRGTAGAEPASPQVRTEIIGLSQQLVDALGAAGGQDVWQRILSDDAMVVDEFGRRQTKKEIVGDIRPFPAGFSGSIELRDAEVRTYGDTAVLVCEEYERETVFGQKFVVRYIETNTFVRQDGAWKLVASEDVTIPTPPPKLNVPGLPMQDYPGTYSYGPGRSWTVSLKDGALSFVTKPGRPPTELYPIAKDVFMDGGDEKNLIIFRRDASGRVTEIIERRKFNDLKLTREGGN